MKKTIMAAAVAATLASTTSGAAVINLIDTGSVKGTQAEKGFAIAAEYWGSMLSNNTVINLEIAFDALPAGVIGSTGSTKTDIAVSDWQSLVNSTKSSSTIDQNIVLPTLNGSGITGMTVGVDGTGNNNTTVSAALDGSQTASQVLYANTSLVKGLLGVDIPSIIDGSMTFSSTFAFDFNPLDGIDAGTFDFIGVAIHEMGHALGFVSGVDYFDIYGVQMVLVMVC